MNLQEIVKKIDSIRASIDTAFETGKLDFDKISSELGAIGDSLADSLKQDSKSESNTISKGPRSLSSVNRNLKIEDYI